MNYEERLHNAYISCDQTIANHAVGWYRRARNAIKEIAIPYDVDWRDAAAACAFLSPNNKWERNLIDLDKVLAAHCEGLLEECLNAYQPREGGYKPLGDKTAFRALKVLAYPHNIIKAYRAITDGFRPETQKVKAFYQGLVGAKNPEVTVDIHMYNLASGTHYSTENVPSIKAATYNEIANAIRSQADYFNHYVLDFQAILWEYQRQKARNEYYAKRYSNAN